MRNDETMRWRSLISRAPRLARLGIGSLCPLSHVRCSNRSIRGQHCHSMPRRKDTAPFLVASILLWSSPWSQGRFQLQPFRRGFDPAVTSKRAASNNRLLNSRDFFLSLGCINDCHPIFRNRNRPPFERYFSGRIKKLPQTAPAPILCFPD